MTTGKDIYFIVDQLTAVGTIRDELTLLRVALKLYADGATKEDAVARACAMLSNSVTKTPTP